MKREFIELSLSEKEAERIAWELFGIQGTAQSLPGEIDMNFKILVPDGNAYVLKVSRPETTVEYLQFQQELLKHLETCDTELEHPRAIADRDGLLVSPYEINSGVRHVRMLSWVPGRMYSQVNPQTDSLRQSLGRVCGRITAALKDFEHKEGFRRLDWDIAQGEWTVRHLELFPFTQSKTIRYFLERFESHRQSYALLRKSMVHNDANDNNILVSENLADPSVVTTIDFGDTIYTQIINDLAVACAYAAMNLNDPLQGILPVIRGYHESFPLQERELKYLYDCIAMRLIISVTKSALNRLEEPDNKYLQISDGQAWDLLEKWRTVSPELAYYSFRASCGYRSHPNYESFLSWAQNLTFTLKELFPTGPGDDAVDIDLSVGSTWLGLKEDFADFGFFDFKIGEFQKADPKKVIAGGYLEARGVYATDSYDKLGNSGKESRTIHLGVDFWLPAGTPVHALLDGEVVTAVNDAGDKEYGGLVILKHQLENFAFFTLYGHLTVASATQWKPGDRILRGEQIAVLGDYPENGNWPPHLHFQVMLSMLDYEIDFPGVGYFNQLDVFKELCPDPNHLFNLQALGPRKPVNEQELLGFRKEHLGRGMSLSYKHPLHIVRGSGAYLIDSTGKKFLDTVNNVAHVGHEHVKVVRAGQAQMAVLNTNTRYLHRNINELAAELLRTLPKELSVVHFVNSGSEANELALRMIKTATGQKDVLASEVGYHGNTNACISVSSYKFDGKGGEGSPEHTHIFPLPDSFRGKYRGPDTGEMYISEVQRQITKVRKLGRNIAGLILESIISCGGQVELPDGFMKGAFEAVRQAGGDCISDEVQVGCGRMGKTFWGFELHGVIPDIITLGKPLGNGHPIAAVVCTEEIARKFANGMEFFNTFGGNPVSCAIATQVLRTVREEKLQENALSTGEFIKKELNLLGKRFPILGDIRGQGLFLGVELVDENLDPLPEQATYLVDRMKEFGILMSTDGPDHNVLKIKPPMIFTQDQGRELIATLEIVLKEDFMQLESTKKTSR
jgi:4-aminobutyrate aminotransferase-like enzyme/Ser/Thr protein kinase RdoA (MazF antagonist)